MRGLIMCTTLAMGTCLFFASVLVPQLASNAAALPSQNSLRLIVDCPDGPVQAQFFLRPEPGNAKLEIAFLTAYKTQSDNPFLTCERITLFKSRDLELGPVTAHAPQGDIALDLHQDVLNIDTSRAGRSTRFTVTLPLDTLLQRFGLFSQRADLLIETQYATSPKDNILGDRFEIKLSHPTGYRFDPLPEAFFRPPEYKQETFYIREVQFAEEQPDATGLFADGRVTRNETRLQINLIHNSATVLIQLAGFLSAALFGIGLTLLVETSLSRSKSR